jgi:hypothetical protein
LGTPPILQYRLEKLHGPRIARLTQPEHCLLAHVGIAVGSRELDQLRHRFVLRQLADGKDRLDPDIMIRIVVDSTAQRADGTRASLLSEPEQRLSPHVASRVVARQIDQRVDAAIAGQREHERQMLAKVVVSIGSGQPFDQRCAEFAA